MTNRFNNNKQLLIVFIHFFLECPQGKYKPDTSNQPECLTCPLNSWSKVNASQFCSCLDGFYRFNSTDFAAPCIRKFFSKCLLFIYLHLKTGKKNREENKTIYLIYFCLLFILRNII